jgi:hypothetical protein
VAVEVTPDNMATQLFDTPPQPWKRVRHWYLPQAHAFLRGARLLSRSYDDPEVMLHGAPFQQAKAGFLRELGLHGSPILPASAAIEVHASFFRTKCHQIFSLHFTLPSNAHPVIVACMIS